MISIFVLLLLSFLIFLFVVFALTKDDFILIRKNISTEQIFNIAFLVGFAALFSARAVFVISHFTPHYYNPLVFLLFPYFPGLSLLGAVFGGTFCIALYARFHKIPTLRVLDFFSIAASSGIMLGLFIEYLFTRNLSLYILPLEAVLFGVVSLLLGKLTQLNKLKEGSISFIFFSSLSFIFLVGAFMTFKNISFFVQRESILLIIILLFGVAMVIKNERRPSTRKKWKSIL